MDRRARAAALTARCPRPLPRERRARPARRFYRALRKNPLTAWRDAHFEELVIAGRNAGRTVRGLNDPELIRRVLVGQRRQLSGRTICSCEKLDAAVGRGACSPPTATYWRLQRRTVAPLFPPRGACGVLSRPMVAVGRCSRRWDRQRAAGERRRPAHEMTPRDPTTCISRTVFGHEIETPPDVIGRGDHHAISTRSAASILWTCFRLPRLGAAIGRFIRAQARPYGLPRGGAGGLLEQAAAHGRRRAACRTISSPCLIAARDPETGTPLRTR